MVKYTNGHTTRAFLVRAVYKFKGSGNLWGERLPSSIVWSWISRHASNLKTVEAAAWESLKMSEVGSENNRWKCLYKWYSYSVDRGLSFVAYISFWQFDVEASNLELCCPQRLWEFSWASVALTTAGSSTQVEGLPIWRFGKLCQACCDQRVPSPWLLNECLDWEVKVRRWNELGGFRVGLVLQQLDSFKVPVLCAESYLHCEPADDGPGGVTWCDQSFADQGHLGHLGWLPPLGAGMARRSWLLGGILNGSSLFWLLHDDCTNCWLWIECFWMA